MKVKNRTLSLRTDIPVIAKVKSKTVHEFHELTRKLFKSTLVNF
jgi:hypothetical protein